MNERSICIAFLGSVSLVLSIGALLAVIRQTPIPDGYWAALSASVATVAALIRFPPDNGKQA